MTEGERHVAYDMATVMVDPAVTVTEFEAAALTIGEVMYPALRAAEQDDAACVRPLAEA